MSEENLATIRALYGAWGDDDLDALMRVVDPEVEFRPSGAFPDLAPVYRGHAGVRAFWDAMRAPWESLRIDVEDIVEGQGCAAVALHLQGAGKGSGVITDLQQGHALWFRGGRVVMASAHRSFNEALEAAGLSE